MDEVATPQSDRAARYVELGPLAAGGMATVTLARESLPGGLRRRVVVKRIRPEYADDAEFTKLFLTEAKVACGLSHPNIGRVLDYGRDERGQFLVLEYIHGENLNRVVARAASASGLPLGDALYIVSKVAAGLHYAHEFRDERGEPLNLVHRDVSPSNVLVGHDGGIRLIDFGVAKSYAQAKSETGSLKGKVAYMSPEQCEGAVLDRRSDVFALGVLLYEATLGVRLFHGRNEFHVMNRIRKGEFRPPREVDPDYPAALERVVLRALAIDLDARFASAEAFQTAVEDVGRTLQIPMSDVGIRELMTQLFGHQPQPRLTEEPANDDGGAERIASTPPAAPRTKGLAVAAGVIAVIVLGAWFALGRQSPPSDAKAIADEPAPSGEVRRPAATAEAEPGDDGEVAPAAAEVATEVGTAADATEPPLAPPRPRPAKRKTRKKRARPTPPDTKTLMPPA